MKKIIILTVITLVIIISVTGCVVKNRVHTQVKELFKMNKTLQEEGYYMSDFEFKMLGFAYYLDKGHYCKGLSRLSDFHHQLKNRENLIKIPEFKSKEEEIEFYLSLQNPKTGAFIDDSCPYCMYNEPTENIVAHLDALAKETGIPLQLKYPLKYLDEINTPGKLQAFLDDVSYIGWIGSKFPQTSYACARSLLNSWNGEGVIVKNNLYSFSPEYKAALLSWFYNSQDSTTGFWGPKSRKNGQLLNLDINNTASIIKTFVDENGNSIHEAFPLKYSQKLFESTLKVLSEPVPADDKTSELHEWNLKMSKGIKMLLRYLWKDASANDKQMAKSIIENYIKIKFEKYYIPREGAFSYYPGAEHASLDGTGGFLFNDIGAYSSEKQQKLWGSPEKNIIDIGDHEVSEITKNDLDLISKQENINSLRVYQSCTDYNNLTSGVSMIIYPQEPEVLDVMDLAHKTKKWIHKTSNTMGNWASKEEIMQKFDSIKFDEVPVYIKDSAIEKINSIFQENGKLTVIGFDILQIPRYKIVYKYLK
jgi:hypothetical protein